MLSDEAVQAIRADLPSVTERVYLNTGTFGPLPGPARDAMREHVEWATTTGRIGAAGIDRWHELEDASRSALADVLGCGTEDLALMHSTTDGINTVLAGLPWREGDEIVTGRVEHPGLTEPLAHLAQTRGVVVRAVDLSGGGAVGSVGAAMTARTRLVACSHVLWSTGEIVDLPGILAVAADKQVPVLADGAQAAGAIPLDLASLGCDFYALAGQKWLCGPSGTGALYVRPDRVDQLVPPWRGYVTHDRTPGAPGTEFWPGARRFDVGSVTLTALAGLGAALRWRSAHGLAAGCAYAADLAGRLRARLSEESGSQVAEPGGASPFAAVSLPVSVDPQSVVGEMEAAGVFVRWVPGTPPVVRASVGPWNTAEDCARFLDALRRLPLTEARSAETRTECV